jgi:imidazolonepropionase
MALHLYHGISALWGHEGYQAVCRQGGQLGDPLHHAWLLAEDGLVLALGGTENSTHDELKACGLSIHSVLQGREEEVFRIMSGWQAGNCPRTDLRGDVVMPAFVDPHTHLVWSGDRSPELAMRLAGATYSQIAESGGGIMSSVRQLRACTEEKLLDDSLTRLLRLMQAGVGTVEIKSGYGLDLDSEAKTLRVARALGQSTGIPVQKTFLGLHTLPAEFQGNSKGYVRTVVDRWLPALTDQGLVDAVDIFCEWGYFDTEDLEYLALAAQRLGLPVKAHLNQFNSIGAVRVATGLGLISMDHLEVLSPDDERCLGPEAPIAVGLPLCSLYLGIPFAPLGRMVHRGQRVALGSDLNPGSAPSGNPWLTWSLASLNCGLDPRMAMASMTIMAAAAMGMQERTGSLCPGSRSAFLTLPQGFQPDSAVAAMGFNLASKVYLDKASNSF